MLNLEDKIMSIMNDKFKAYELRMTALEEKSAELGGQVALLAHRTSELERTNAKLQEEIREVNLKCERACNIAVHTLRRTQIVHQENARSKPTSIELSTALNNQHA
jgi:SMC interacting uncharacterized protein involved in chromosome segregation